jgi:hypothetical protein
MLTKDDPKAGGQHRLITMVWVDYVDQKVDLNKPSKNRNVQWQAAA